MMNISNVHFYIFKITFFAVAVVQNYVFQLMHQSSVIKKMNGYMRYTRIYTSLHAFFPFSFKTGTQISLLSL